MNFSRTKWTKKEDNRLLQVMSSTTDKKVNYQTAVVELGRTLYSVQKRLSKLKNKKEGKKNTLIVTPVTNKVFTPKAILPKEKLKDHIVNIPLIISISVKMS